MIKKLWLIWARTLDHRVGKTDEDQPDIPILSLKEISEDQGLRDTGTVVEVDHPVRGKYLTVGNPIKLSDSPAVVKRSPLLGEHTEEILKEFCNMTDEEISAVKEAGAV